MIKKKYHKIQQHCLSNKSQTQLIISWYKWIDLSVWYTVTNGFTDTIKLWENISVMWKLFTMSEVKWGHVDAPSHRKTCFTNEHWGFPAKSKAASAHMNHLYNEILCIIINSGHIFQAIINQTYNMIYTTRAGHGFGLTTPFYCSASLSQFSSACITAAGRSSTLVTNCRTQCRIEQLSFQIFPSGHVGENNRTNREWILALDAIDCQKQPRIKVHAATIILEV